MLLRLFPLLVLSGLVMQACAPKVQVTRTENSQYRMNSEAAVEDSAAVAFIAPYKKAIDTELSAVIGISAQPMEKATPEGLLGNFVADACLKQGNDLLRKRGSTEADFCFLNNGGLRSALPAGELTKKKIFELMPFENALVTLELNGDQAKKLLDFIAAKGGMPVSGLRMQIKNNKAHDVIIRGKPFDGNRTYIIMTSDYLANGGDDLGFLANPLSRVQLYLPVRDAIINHILETDRSGNKIIVSIDGRIKRSE